MCQCEQVALTIFEPCQLIPIQVSDPILRLEPGPKHPFAKFTERARKVLSLANEEAHQYNHDGVGTEHLLLGLLREEEGLASQVLLKSGVTLENAHKLVKQILATEQ